MCAHHSHTRRHTLGGLEGRHTPENCARPGAAHCTPLPPLPSEGQDVDLLGKEPCTSLVTRLPFDLFPPGWVCGLQFSQAFFLIWHTWKLVLITDFLPLSHLIIKISWEEGKESMKCQGKQQKLSRKARLGLRAPWQLVVCLVHCWCSRIWACPTVQLCNFPCSTLTVGLTQPGPCMSFYQKGPGQGDNVKLNCGGWGCPRTFVWVAAPGPSLGAPIHTLLVPLICRRHFPDAQWMPESKENTELYKCYAFFYTYKPMISLI